VSAARRMVVFLLFGSRMKARACVSLHFAGVAFALAFGHGCFGSFVVSVPVTWRAQLSVWGGSRKKERNSQNWGFSGGWALAQAVVSPVGPT
jgi:hypothetical protein